MVVGLFCRDNLTSRIVRWAALTHCHAESVDINTPFELCCLIHIASLLPETLAVWPEGDVGRLSCPGTSLTWLCTLNAPEYQQVFKNIEFSSQKGLKIWFTKVLNSFSCLLFFCVWFLAIWRCYASISENYKCNSELCCRRQFNSFCGVSVKAIRPVAILSAASHSSLEVH